MISQMEQNGIAENRTLLKIACYLFQQSLPIHFQAKAINITNYIQNRCPSSHLDENPFGMKKRSSERKLFPNIRARNSDSETRT